MKRLIWLLPFLAFWPHTAWAAGDCTDKPEVFGTCTPVPGATPSFTPTPSRTPTNTPTNTPTATPVSGLNIRVFGVGGAGHFELWRCAHQRNVGNNDCREVIFDREYVDEAWIQSVTFPNTNLRYYLGVEYGRCNADCGSTWGTPRPGFTPTSGATPTGTTTPVPLEIYGAFLKPEAPANDQIYIPVEVWKCRTNLLECVDTPSYGDASNWQYLKTVDQEDISTVIVSPGSYGLVVPSRSFIGETSQYKVAVYVEDAHEHFLERKDGQWQVYSEFGARGPDIGGSLMQVMGALQPVGNYAVNEWIGDGKACLDIPVGKTRIEFPPPKGSGSSGTGTNRDWLPPPPTGGDSEMIVGCAVEVWRCDAGPYICEETSWPRTWGEEHPGWTYMDYVPAGGDVYDYMASQGSYALVKRFNFPCVGSTIAPWTPKDSWDLDFPHFTTPLDITPGEIQR